MSEQRPRAPDRPERDERGFTIVEVTVSLVFLVIGVLGFVQAMVSSQILVRGTREMNLAQSAIVNAIEDFRYECGLDFDAALASYAAGSVVPALPPALGASAALSLTLIVDEPRISPPTDLNGDGDFLDIGVATTDAAAGVLRANLNWTGVTGRRELEYTTIVAREAR
jgi:type II secretory pathway pseudopilin PulG